MTLLSVWDASLPPKRGEYSRNSSKLFEEPRRKNEDQVNEARLFPSKLTVLLTF